MLAFVRAVVYGTLFVGLLLVFIPREILELTGVRRPLYLGELQVFGIVLVAAGAALALWCIVTFAVVGRGTPAPFDPPRKLVVAGPYRWVRNPMYLGAVGVVLGTASYYQSLALLAFAAAFFGASYLFVVFYEEPTLMRVFGAQYADYYHAVPRWVPRWRS